MARRRKRPPKEGRKSDGRTGDMFGHKAAPALLRDYFEDDEGSKCDHAWIYESMAWEQPEKRKGRRMLNRCKHCDKTKLFEFTLPHPAGFGFKHLDPDVWIGGRGLMSGRVYVLLVHNGVAVKIVTVSDSFEDVMIEAPGKIGYDWGIEAWEDGKPQCQLVWSPRAFGDVFQWATNEWLAEKTAQVLEDALAKHLDQFTAMKNGQKISEISYNGGEDGYKGGEK